MNQLSEMLGVRPPESGELETQHNRKRTRSADEFKDGDAHPNLESPTDMSCTDLNCTNLDCLDCLAKVKALTDGLWVATLTASAQADPNQQLRG